jgi:hypothetical protein
MGDVGIVTNPPYRLVEKFIRKAIADGCTFHVASHEFFGIPRTHVALARSPAESSLVFKHPPADDASIRMVGAKGDLQPGLRVVRLGRFCREETVRPFRLDGFNMNAFPRPLRPYQSHAIELLRQSLREGGRRPVLQLPCGAGKTRVAAEIASSALGRSKRVIFVVRARWRGPTERSQECV